MEKRILANGLIKIGTATNRKFTDENELDMIYDQLKLIPDNDFEKITEMYISILKPPTNFIRYFKEIWSYIKASKNAQFKLPEKDCDPINEKLYMMCFKKAMEKYFDDKIEFNSWRNTFNRYWFGKDGNELTEYLKAELIKLEGS